MKTKILPLALVMAALTISCAGTGRSIFQIHENPLTETIRDRTRSVKLYSQFDTVLILDGALYDMEARRVKVEQEAESKRLAPDQKAAALKAESEADSAEAQFILGLYTANEDWNDLAEKNSRWSVFLETPAGPERPSSIAKVEREKLELRDTLPFASNFRRFYIVKFSREKTGGPPYRLTLSGSLGEVSLNWEK